MANNVSLSYPSSFYHQFFDRNGKPLSGGKLYTYIAGSSTSVVTYKTISGGTESANRNTNPIILDMAGMAELVISTDTAYKFILFDKNNVKIDEWDNVTAGGSEGGGSSNVYVEGTDGEIDVREEREGLIRRFIVSLSDSIKNAISDLSSSVNDIINDLYNKKDKQQPVTKLGSTTKVPVSIQQNANGVLDVEFDDIAFPDWTTSINDAVANCEKLSNKKNSVTGYESSTTAYPSIKAVVDFVNNIMQNLGGKLITDNGEPFSNSNDLPSTTPYQGVTIADKDYAYVQGTGFAERWSASVSGSDVAWVQEYSINIPVFTPAQQAAIDSGATSTKIGNYDAHIANTTIHVTSTEKNTWNAKQNAISDLAEIRSGAAAGATALQPNGNGSNVTSTFTAASSRTNISSGEKLSTIFGKIAKWFADLKAVAFSGSYNDLSNKPTIPAAANNGVLTIKQNGTSKGTFSANQSSNTEINVNDTTYESKSAASGGTALSLVTTGEKYNWNAKQDALPTSGTASSTYAINVSGNAATATKATAIQSQGEATGTMHPVVFDGTGVGNKFAYVMKNVTSYYDAGNGTIWIVGTTGGTKDRKATGSLRLGNGAYKGQIWPDNLTANRDYQLPDAGGTFALLGNIGSATLTIQKNGTNVATFGANATSNVTANISVPTKTSELTNDSNFLTTSGNGSNVTSTFTKNASDTSGMTSGSELSALFNAISDFFASLKALAFKDKVANSDISGTISDSHIASASTWNNKAEKNGDYRNNGLQAAYSTQSGFANESTYAEKIGSSASHPQIGGQYQPVYVDSFGNVQECQPPSLWSVGTAGFADLARYIYSTEFGGCDKPTFIKTTGQTNVAELGSSFDIPHFVTRWHEELYYPSKTGFGIIHRTDKFSDPTTKYMHLGIEIANDNASFNLVLDGSSLTPWFGGQVFGTIKWDSQSGSNLNSAIARIGNSNITDSKTVLATRNISTSNQQDIQGHALFAICTGDFLHRYVVDMEISLIKPQAGSSVSYVSVVSKCYTVSPLV